MSTKELSVTDENVEVDNKDPGVVHTEVKGGFFGSKTVVEFPPKAVLFDFKEGAEKQVRDSLKGDMFEMIRKLEWSKQSVSYKIFKVDSHPRLESGYVYEVQLNGDGGSYIEKVLELFKDPEVDNVWIECPKSDWVFVELRLGKLETAFSPIPPKEGDLIVSFVDKPRTMGAMFVDSYAFYHVSLLLLFLSVLSFTLAGMFKYVWLDDTKKMVNKSYYNKDKYMPVSTLNAIEATETFYLAAIRYSQSKKWHFVYHERNELDGILTEYEQRISKDGQPLDMVKTKETPFDVPATDTTVLDDSVQGE